MSGLRFKQRPQEHFRRLRQNFRERSRLDAPWVVLAMHEGAVVGIGLTRETLVERLAIDGVKWSELVDREVVA